MHKGEKGQRGREKRGGVWIGGGGFGSKLIHRTNSRDYPRAIYYLIPTYHKKKDQLFPSPPFSFTALPSLLLVPHYSKSSRAAERSAQKNRGTAREALEIEFLRRAAPAGRDASVFSSLLEQEERGKWQVWGAGWRGCKGEGESFWPIDIIQAAWKTRNKNYS